MFQSFLTRNVFRVCKTFFSGATVPTKYSKLLQSDKRFSSNTGFSAFSPSTLNEIVKLELLQEESPNRITEIWKEFHKEKDSAVGYTLDGPSYDIITKRMKKR